MIIVFKILSLIGLLSIAFIIYLFATDNVKFINPEYEYSSSDDQFVKASIKYSIEENSKSKILEFGAVEVVHLSGKTFKLKGRIVYESVIGTKINKDFECVATGYTWNTNPSDNYRINLYYEY